MTPLDRSTLLHDEAARLLADIRRNTETRTLLVTGCAGGEGATTIAIALARAAARRELEKCLLVDANFARPELTRLAGAAGRSGLRDLKHDPSGVHGLVAALADGIDVLPVGTAPTPMSELVASGAVAGLIEAALAKYGLVLVDGRGLTGSGDTGLLLAAVPDVVLVTRSDVTRMDHFTASLNDLSDAGAYPVAVLRNGARRGWFSTAA
ncbi:MAG: hypothetical protein KF914_08420 [Rhizobiaceae bacterium]|nr:hypothetical protein [Rhizobiaceae bacterium]